MIDATGLHGLFVGLHIGGLVLAAAGLLGLTFQVFRWRSIHGRWPRLGWFFRSTPKIADPLAYGGAVALLVGFWGRTIMEFPSWSGSNLGPSTQTLNMAMLSVLASELWLIFLFLKFSYRGRVRRSQGLLAIYLGTGFLALGLAGVASSLGGRLAGGTSLLDTIYGVFIIDPSTPWIFYPFTWFAEVVRDVRPFFGLPPQTVYLLLATADVAVILAVISHFVSEYLRPRLRAERESRRTPEESPDQSEGRTPT